MIEPRTLTQIDNRTRPGVRVKSARCRLSPACDRFGRGNFGQSQTAIGNELGLMSSDLRPGNVPHY